MMLGLNSFTKCVLESQPVGGLPILVIHHRDLPIGKLLEF